MEPEPRTLGDLPVLAEAAMEGATRRRDGVRGRARRDVEQGLLLDGIEADGHDGPVREAHQLARADLADATDATPPRTHEAAMGADAAAHAPVRIRRAEDGRDRDGRGCAGWWHGRLPGRSCDGSRGRRPVPCGTFVGKDRTHGDPSPCRRIVRRRRAHCREATAHAKRPCLRPRTTTDLARHRRSMSRRSRGASCSTSLAPRWPR